MGACGDAPVLLVNNKRMCVKMAPPALDALVEELREAVRAIGLALEDQGLVQVSMNLVNYARTPIPRVMEMVRAEARRYGVIVAGSELVGPVPGAAPVQRPDDLTIDDFVIDAQTEQVTCCPDGVERISGSRVNLPTMIALLTFIYFSF